MKLVKSLFVVLCIGIVTVSTAIILFLISSMDAPVMGDEKDQMWMITAKRFEYSPKEITVKKGVPVVLQFASADRVHGFACPGLGIRADIRPGKVNSIRFIPDKVGTFPFHCDNFCGTGHEGMAGIITVTE